MAQRRRRTAALLGCLGVLVGLPVAWMMAEPARAVAEATADKVQDLADLLSERSPGTRTQDELTKHARAVAKVRTPPKAAHPDTPKAARLVDLLLRPPPAPVQIAVGELPSPLAPPPTLGTVLASTPGFTPPSDSHGGSATLPSSELREALPPASAVPEPGTWAMMLTGFGLVAWRVRRRRRPAEKLKRARL
jgi:hypothetical protein